MKPNRTAIQSIDTKIEQALILSEPTALPSNPPFTLLTEHHKRALLGQQICGYDGQG
jgi:hypothetical protein